MQLGSKPRAFALLRQFIAGRHPPAWNHLAEVVLSNPRQDIYVGDMPHTWAGADLVTAIRNLLLYECADRLVLLAGVPESWVTEGNGLRLERSLTLRTENNRIATGYLEVVNRRLLSGATNEIKISPVSVEKRADAASSFSP